MLTFTLGEHTVPQTDTSPADRAKEVNRLSIYLYQSRKSYIPVILFNTKANFNYALTNSRRDFQVLITFEILRSIVTIEE